MKKDKIDIALIGGGIMSATLATLLNQLMPDAKMHVFERLNKVAEESSDAWNNAGTGHSAFCELNYTPQKEDGTIDCSKAIKIAEQFELSKQFWAYLVEHHFVGNADSFIHQIPHYSFVKGKDDVDFLHKRFDVLSKNPLFNEMELSDDFETLKAWFPLVMNERNQAEKVAATKMKIGTDVDFGKLTELLFAHLENQHCCNIFVNHEVIDIDRNDDNTWEIEVEDLSTKTKKKIDANFLFVGAGGGALKLLNKSDIEEVDGYGGFPVGGKWLKCNNEKVIYDHFAKVYGKAEIGAPPMSVPHLDTRIINGERQMLFGPYAGFSTKFLKHGSLLDLPTSLDTDNFIPMIQVGLHNIPLTKYLIDQVRMNFHEKFEALLNYFPTAKEEDWELVEAGQRVQVIKKNDEGEGVLEFGTELIATKDGTLAGLLGASPGASTATAIMLNLLKKCFPDKINSVEWQHKLKEIFPSYGQSLNENEMLLKEVRNNCRDVLGLV